MKLEILGVRSAGDLFRERVVFRADGDGDIGRFLVTTSRLTGEKSVSSHIENPFWFPDKSVKSGDTVVLYTKLGGNNSVENDDRTTSHFYYMGKDSPIYVLPDVCVVLMDSNPWVFSTKRLTDES